MNNHLVVLIAWIPLTLLSFALGPTSRWYSMVTQSCLANTGVSIYGSPLMSSSLLLQHVSFILLGWFVREIGEKWLYSCCFMESCFQDLFKTAQSILGSSIYLFSKCFVKVHGVLSCNSTDTATACKHFYFILSEVRSSYEW